MNKNQRRFPLLLLMFGFFPAAEAEAAIVHVDLSVDLASSEVIPFTTPLGIPTELWTENFIDVGPTYLEPGDVLQVELSFLDGQFLEVTPGLFGNNLSFGPQPPIDCSSFCESTTTLTDIVIVDGTIDVALPAQYSVLAAGFFPGAFIGTLSDSTFAFSAVSVSIELDLETPVTFSQMNFLAQADKLQVRTVPLPAALWLLVGAIACLPAARITPIK